MTTPNGSFEASLLFAAPLSKDVVSETPELTRCLDSLGWPVETVRSVPRDHVVLHCATVQILIAQGALPFEMSDFRGVVRPESDPERDARALDRLRAHKASITVLVADRPGARASESARTKALICWEIADLMSEAMGAEMVFWDPTDTLYFADEFAEASFAGNRALPVPAPTTPAGPAIDVAVPDTVAGLPVVAAPRGLDFLGPLDEDRPQVPEIARRIAEATPAEIAEAELRHARLTDAAHGSARFGQLASVAALTVIGVALASYSVLSGLLRNF